MKLIKNNRTKVIVSSVIILFVFLLNIFWKTYPVFELMKYLEKKNLAWILPATLLSVLILWIYNRSMKKKIVKERIDIFNATIRTIQDILHNSASSMQLLILDMKEGNVTEEIIKGAEKNFEELKKAIQTLSAIDPETIEVKELNKNVSVIRMDE